MPHFFFLCHGRHRCCSSIPALITWIPFQILGLIPLKSKDIILLPMIRIWNCSSTLLFWATLELNPSGYYFGMLV
jgi:hypothetical protein